MNFSKKYKVVWLAPERTGTKIISSVFSNFDFEYINSPNQESPKKIIDVSQTKNLSNINYSHNVFHSEIFDGYKIISSIRNPYDRILSLYVNFTTSGSDILITKKNKNFVKEKFNNFIDEAFFSWEEKLNGILKSDFQFFENYIYKWNFRNVIPTEFIRLENLETDLGKIDFIRESEIWENGMIHKMLENNNFKNLRQYNFQELYTIEGAQKVYKFYKNHFFWADYDPFSFSQETFDDETKKRFLHGII